MDAQAIPSTVDVYDVTQLDQPDRDGTVFESAEDGDLSLDGFLHRDAAPGDQTHGQPLDLPPSGSTGGQDAVDPAPAASGVVASTDVPAIGSRSASSLTPAAPGDQSRFGRLCFGWIGDLVNSAAGYDEKILRQYGTAIDDKRRRNIGRAIVVATLVGALGWFVKIMLAFPGWLAFPVALTMASLYAVLSYSLESFFAANVNPFAGVLSKALSLTGRALLSAVIAFSGALPWVTMALSSSVKLELAKMGLAEQAALRQGVESANGLGEIEKRSSDLQAEAQRWTAALSTMPVPVQTALDDAQACAASFVKLSEANTSRLAFLSTRLPVLAKMESRSDVSQQTLKAVAAERAQIRSQMSRLATETAQKKASCEQLNAQAQEARTAHLTMAEQERLSAEQRLSAHRKEEDAVSATVRAEQARVDAVAKVGAADNSSGEFAALVQIIRTQVYAQLIAGLIFIGLFLVDVLPLTLRLFARPGPYDAEARTDSAIRIMRAEGRYHEAELIHSARCSEIQSQALRDIVQADVRPHIRSVVRAKMERVLAKDGIAAPAGEGSAA